MNKSDDIDGYFVDEGLVIITKKEKFFKFWKSNKGLVVLVAVCVSLLAIVTTMVVLLVKEPKVTPPSTTVPGTTLQRPSTTATTTEPTTTEPTTEESTTAPVEETIPDAFTLAPDISEITTIASDVVARTEAPVSVFEEDDGETPLTFAPTTTLAPVTATEEVATTMTATEAATGETTAKLWTMQDVIDGNCSLDDYLNQN